MLDMAMVLLFTKIKDPHVLNRGHQKKLREPTHSYDGIMQITVCIRVVSLMLIAIQLEM